MLNGRKNAVIGLGALFAFVFLELIAIAAVVAVLLSILMGVELPFLAASR